MSTEQVDASRQPPVQVDNWDALVRYTELLSKGSGKDVKICVIDEEQEEIRLQSKDEFDFNVKYAQDHEIQSLTLVVYIGDKHVFNGIYRVEPIVKKPIFPTEKLQTLFDNVLAEKWYIPVKQDEALGVCLTAAINLAQENKTETIDECKLFIENIVPEAFRKLQNTPSVLQWSREIQCGVFELIELLVDLVATRLRYPPVPIVLLNTLAMTFDTNTSFSQKHKNELLPARRAYTLKDEDFLSNDFDSETFGWLRSLIQRFIAQNYLTNVRLQFEYIDSSNSTTAAMEYNALLKLFAKCKRCINTHRFRTIFIRPIRQVIQYLQTQQLSNVMTSELQELNETLLDICNKYELKDEMAKLTDSILDSTIYQISSSSIETCSEITPLIDISSSVQRKTKNPDTYERLAEDIQSMTMTCNDLERKIIKKQRIDEQTPTTPLFSRSNLLDCIDELLTTTDKRALKRKHRREQRSTITTANTSHTNKKEHKQSTTSKTYDRSNPEEILRYFAPMKLKIATLYDNLLAATSSGNLREVLKIQEKLKLINPFSARFIADENTPDGTTMQPGEVFRKGWILLNDGSMPWDSHDIQLINLSNGIEVLQQPMVPITAPHDRAVITVDYKCANQSGTYESKWILAYREQTFGPMIWCSIEVNPTKKINQENPLQDFEFIEVPLPACFDLSKPYQSEENSLRSSYILPCSGSIDSTCDTLQCSTISDCDSFSNFLSLPSMKFQTEELTHEQPVPLIDLTSENPPPTESDTEERSSIRLNQSLDFVDTVVTNIFSVAKQAGSTAKAIFNTLQAIDEPIAEPKPMLINTFSASETSTNGFFDQIELPPSSSMNSIPSKDPIKTLIEMGFANRTRNQRLLRENANDLAKVIELLTLENNDDVDAFTHRH